MNLSSDSVWSDIKEFAKLKYKVGFTIAARKYDLNAVSPLQTSDILDLLSVGKHLIPLCSEAKDLIEIGKAQLAEMNAQKQKSQTLDVASTKKTIELFQVCPHLIHKLAVARGSGSSSSSMSKSFNAAAMMGEAIPRGRGVDERAARATTGVRKKAAARGLPIHPLGVPVQAMPPHTQLLNIINPGMTPNSVDNDTASGVKQANSQTSNGSVDAKKDQQPAQDKQAPVGFGKGLASLDAKKQKIK